MTEKELKKVLDKVIVDANICASEGLAVPDILFGYSKALDAYVAAGLITLDVAEELTALAGKTASVCTYYRETGKISTRSLEAMK